MATLKYMYDVFIKGQRLVDVIAWCHPAVLHHFLPCWRRSTTPYGVIKLQLIDSSPPGQNGRHFDRRQFQMHFLEWKWCNYDSNFIEISSQKSDWQYASTGSGISLAPNRQQAITWTNAYPAYWRINVALGGKWVKGRRLTCKWKGGHKTNLLGVQYDRITIPSA